MGLKGLAEGIILQSLADLWDERERDASIAFFRGQDFSTCAKTAGMNLEDQIRLLNMVKEAIDQNHPTKEPLQQPRQRQQKTRSQLSAC